MRKLAFSIFNSGNNNQKKRRVMRILILSVLAFLLLFEEDALAGDCTIDNYFKNESISFGSINVSGSLPIGSIIKEVETTPPNILIGKCYGNYYYGSEMNYSSIQTNLDKVYKTNLDGVGITVRGCIVTTIKLLIMALMVMASLMINILILDIIPQSRYS